MMERKDKQLKGHDWTWTVDRGGAIRRPGDRECRDVKLDSTWRRLYDTDGEDGRSEAESETRCLGSRSGSDDLEPESERHGVSWNTR